MSQFRVFSRNTKPQAKCGFDLTGERRWSGCASSIAVGVPYVLVTVKPGFAVCADCWNKAHPDDKWQEPVARPKLKIINIVANEHGAVFLAKYDYRTREYYPVPMSRQQGQWLLNVIPILMEQGEKALAVKEKAMKEIESLLSAQDTKQEQEQQPEKQSSNVDVPAI